MSGVRSPELDPEEVVPELLEVLVLEVVPEVLVLEVVPEVLELVVLELVVLELVVLEVEVLPEDDELGTHDPATHWKNKGQVDSCKHVPPEHTPSKHCDGLLKAEQSVF